MFLEKFLNFLKSDNLIYKITTEDDEKKFAQKIEATENVNVVYLYTVDNVLKRIEMTPSILVDKQGNLLSIKNTYACDDFKSYLFNEDIYEASRLITSKIKDFENEIINEVKVKLASKELDFLKDYDTDYYRKEAINCKINNSYPHFDVYFEYENKDIFFVDKYYFDRKTLLEDTVANLVEKNEPRYKNYFLTKFEIERMEKENEEDENKKFLNTLVGLLDNPKHKTLKISFKHPDGTIDNREIQKLNNYSISRFKRDILSNYILENIPVFAIETVKWSRSTLLDRKKFGLKIDNSKLLNTFVECDAVEHFPKEYYKDQGFIKKIVDKHDRNIKYADESLLADKKFCNDLINILCCKRTILNYIDKSLAHDQDFIGNFLDSLSDNEKIYTLGSFRKEVLEDYDFVKFLNSKGIPFTKIANYVSNAFIINKKFEEILNGEKLDTVSDSKIVEDNRLSILEKFYTKEALKRYSDYIDFSKESADKLCEYINMGAYIDVLEADNGALPLINSYIDDDFMIFELSKTFNNAYYIPKFLAKLGIDKDKEPEKVLPFCSYNPLFLNYVRKDEHITFIESEIANIESFKINNDEEISFTTDFCTFEFKGYSDINDSSSFVNVGVTSSNDNIKSYFYFRDSEVRNTAIENIKEYVKKLTGKEVTTFSQMREALEKIEKINELER